MGICAIIPATELDMDLLFTSLKMKIKINQEPTS
jgi:hypothetical protein